MIHKAYRYLIILALAPLLFLQGCYLADKEHTVEPAFYYWKSQASFNSAERSAIQMAARKLYVKYFDVAWNPTQSAIPVAKVQFADSTRAFLAREQVQVVPTVFITNETIQQLDSAAIPGLAARIADLIASIHLKELPSMPVQEIQLDCDWTATTQNRYFRLLEEIRKHPFVKGKILSATIRLYQCKYRSKTGIPPVDRGLLMCYNMGNLKHMLTKNSIIDVAEMEAYISELEFYPLDLDIAFPLFNWKVLFRNNQYTGLIQNLPTENLDNTLLTNREGNTFRLLKDTLLLGYDLHKDDLIRQEDSNFETVLRAAQLLKPKIRNEKLTLALFHLDSTILTNYSTHEIQTILRSLH